MIKDLYKIINIHSFDNPKENPEIISLYDLAIILTKKKEEFANKEKQNNLLLYYIICDNYKLFFESFDFTKEKITFRIRRIGDMSNIYGHISFTKNNQGLIMTDIDTLTKINIHNPFLKETISHYYDFLLNNKDYYLRTYIIRFLSANIQVSISKDDITIFDDNYKIKANINTNRYECNFNIVEAFEDESHNREVLKDLLINKDKLFKSIYVPIEGCPKWCQKEIKASQKESVKTYSK